ncbi:MAG: tRNA (guanosine(37)-N1)-methyltransferase TrmD [Spirochaetales bacterium]|nr:tRNA (guanosine(37)-N1)-methyltransferase TrmD [Spirochaetales bacterium]
MIFHVLTLFPEAFSGFLASSILGKAIVGKLLDVNLVDIRDFACDKHRTCDDYTYGGGPGMVLKPEPLSACLEDVGKAGKRIIYLTPSGKLFHQAYAENLAREEEVVLICGRYETIDQRIIDRYVDDEISIGDYILASGETAAMVVIDAVSRLVPGVIKKESLEEESFTKGLLEYPQYTRPEEFLGIRVPEVLLSGHHENIRKWRLKKSLEKTLHNRPELIEERDLTEEEKEFLRDLQGEGEDNGCDESDPK